MIPSPRYLEAFQKGRKYMVSLGAADPRFKRTVKVIHQDGSIFVLTHAFIAFDEENYFIVIPEHHDVHIFYKHDLHDWEELDPKYPIQELMPLKGKDASKRDRRKDPNR